MGRDFRPLPSQYLWQSPKISAIFRDWVAPPTMMELHYRHFAGNLHFKKSVHMCFSDQILRFPDKNIPSMQVWDWWFIQYLFVRSIQWAHTINRSGSKEFEYLTAGILYFSEFPQDPQDTPKEYAASALFGGSIFSKLL